MTYHIGDRTVSFDKGSILPEDIILFRKRPEILCMCVNDATKRLLLRVKKVVHLFTDIITIYNTLLMKVPNFDDVTMMTSKTRHSLSCLETDLNRIFGDEGKTRNNDWERMEYEGKVKVLAQMVLKSFNEVLQLVRNNLNCIIVFFTQFDNLKKLLIPCLMSHTQMIQKLTSSSLFLLQIKIELGSNSASDSGSSVFEKQIKKIHAITEGLERESRLLEMIFGTLDLSLQQYTNLLIGKAILKRAVSEKDCQLISRRSMCYQAVENVLSIPMTGSQGYSLLYDLATRHVVYFASIFVLIISLLIYKFYTLIPC